MICEIISKTVCTIFLIFSLHFINNFVVKKSFLEPQNHQKLNISRPNYFKNFLSEQITWKDFFNFVFKDLELFSCVKPLTEASFFAQKINCILFFRKTEKKSDFILLRRSFKPYKLL